MKWHADPVFAGDDRFGSKLPVDLEIGIVPALSLIHIFGNVGDGGNAFGEEAILCLASFQFLLGLPLLGAAT